MDRADSFRILDALTFKGANLLPDYGRFRVGKLVDPGRRRLGRLLGCLGFRRSFHRPQKRLDVASARHSGLGGLHRAERPVHQFLAELVGLLTINHVPG